VSDACTLLLAVHSSSVVLCILGRSMNSDLFDIAKHFVDASYIAQAQQARKRHEKLIKTLLSQVRFLRRDVTPSVFMRHAAIVQRQLPAEGWNDSTIELFLNELALMDSNNFLGSHVRLS
jgi:O-phospho-L-seryl-tRNASec:L-selenocysteinyl-tRNA synthase